jgi:hypothetical protein
MVIGDYAEIVSATREQVKQKRKRFQFFLTSVGLIDSIAA